MSIRWSDKENELLTNMFQGGEIDKTDSPSDIYEQHKATFGKFQKSAFGRHFHKIKKLHMSVDEKSDEKSTSAMKRDLSMYLGEDVLVTPPVKHTKNAVSDGDFDDSSFVTGDNENDPVVICHFRRGVAKKIGVLATMPSGSTNHTWRFLEGIKSGTTDRGVITFDWGRSSFDPRWAFQDEIRSKKIEENDPMILAMESMLHGRKSVNEKYPKGKIFIKLPVLVQSTQNSWEEKVLKGLPENLLNRKGYVGVLIKLVLYEIEEEEYREVRPLVLEF